MAYFDPHIHMHSRTTDDYTAMAKAGITAIVEPAFWLGQPRTHVGSFEDYFLSLAGWEPFRASQFGIHHFCTIAMNPKEANRPDISAGVLEIMPRYLGRETVVAVGEIGLDDNTPQEEKIFQAQIEMAKEAGLPILVHTPHRDKKNGTFRCLDIVRESGIEPGMALIDHAVEQTIHRILDEGFWAGHSIYPNTKMDARRMTEIIKEVGTDRIIINSAADWGVSDPLMVPKTAAYMAENGISAADVDQVTFENPRIFFAQSGRPALQDSATLRRPRRRNQAELFEGNSVLRGQTPVIDT